MKPQVINLTCQSMIFINIVEIQDKKWGNVVKRYVNKLKKISTQAKLDKREFVSDFIDRVLKKSMYDEFKKYYFNNNIF